MFTRLFSVFNFGKPGGRCPAPKRRALPTAPHPEILNLIYFLRSCPLRFLLQLRLCHRRGSPIAKLLPLLIARSTTHRVRSQTSPAAPHPEIFNNFTAPKYYNRFIEICQVNFTLYNIKSREISRLLFLNSVTLIFVISH